MAGGTGGQHPGWAWRPSDQDHRKVLARIVAFSDGVFAIAMTLLVAQITVPALPEGLAAAEEGRQLTAELSERRAEYFSFLLSFGVTAIYWVAHNRKFAYVVRYDGTLIWLNFLLLLCVVFVPYPTAVLGRYPDQAVATVFYAATLGVTGLVSTAMNTYVISRKLADETVPDVVLKHGIARGMVIPLVFFASIPVAAVDPSAGQLSWIVVFVATRVLEWRYRRRRGAGQV